MKDFSATAAPATAAPAAFNASLRAKTIPSAYLLPAAAMHTDWANPYAPPAGLLKRISPAQALELLRSKSLAELGALAKAARQALHPQNIATFVIDRNINYTNICRIDCKFCAFYRHGKDADAYVLSYEQISQKIAELEAIGGTQILFQGGVHPELRIEWYEDLLRFICERHPSIAVHGFSAVEIAYIAKISKITTQQVLERLSAAGLYSIPGAGAEILSERVRKLVAPRKCSTAEWLAIHRQAHELGLLSSATMMFGHVESDEEIIEHLEHLRQLQDATGGFRAFILWSFQGANTPLKRERPELLHASSARYLRLLAIARLYLDNFSNIQSSWVTQGAYIGQLALEFGANDLGSTMMEENVVAAAGAKFRMNEAQLIEQIKQLGLRPARRDTAYNIVEFYDAAGASEPAAAQAATSEPAASEPATAEADRARA